MKKEEILAMEAAKPLDEIIHTKIFGVDVEKKRKTFQWVIVPDYSKDISRAWVIVEKLKGNGEFDLYWFNDHWSCWFGKNETVNAETAPEAICKAALLAVMDS